MTFYLKMDCLLGQCSGYARMLGDLPGNYLSTEEFADYAEELAQRLTIPYQSYGKKELEEMGCGGILGVNQASEREARLLVLSYEGNQGAPYTALVGKGILFDSGGYHLIGMEDMEGMKYDMCGAADVLPLDPSFHEALRWSKTADLLNYVPGKGGGASITACFLEEFIEEGVKWAHFDMVGPAVAIKNSTNMEAGATGVMISTIAAFLEELALGEKGGNL